MGHTNDLRGRPDLVHALGRLESERVESRQSVLLELRRIITDGRQRSETIQIDDRGYHAILESIFRLVKADVSNLVRATKYTTSKVSSRLATCANVIRTIVDVGLPKLRHRTVKAVSEHVCQTLATPGTGYCEPLSIDYFKTLALLLGHQAHVEHLTPDEWHDLLRFVTKAIQDLNSIRPPTSPGAPSLSSSLSVRGRELNTTAPTEQYSNTKRLTFQHLQSSNETILLCLRHLISATNAPLLEKSEMILQVVVELLENYPHQSKIQQSAYETLEVVLTHTGISDVDLSLRTLVRLIPLTRKMWPRASHSQREAILAVFIRCRSLLPHISKASTEEDLELGLSDLLDVVRDQYVSRNPREQLALDDISFPDKYTNGERLITLQLRSSSLRIGACRSEEPWSVIYLSAMLHVVLDRLIQTPADGSKENGRPITAKRQKKNSPFVDLFQDVKTSPLTTKIYTLQVIAFVLDIQCLQWHILSACVECLISLLSNDDLVLVSWAIFAFISVADQDPLMVEKHDIPWTRIWELISRHVTASNTCRVASYALSILVEKDLVEKHSIRDTFDGIMASSLLNSPAECDSASCRLFDGLLILRHKQSLHLDVASAQSVLHWLYKSWNPGKIFDRSHTSYVSRNVSTHGLISLICLCLGIPRYISSSWCVGQRAHLSQAYMASQARLPLAKYLLHDVAVRPSTVRTPLEKDAALFQGGFSEKSAEELIESFLDFLDRECKATYLALYSDQSTCPPGTGVEVTQIILQLCIVGCGVLSCLPTNSPRVALTMKSLNNLQEGIAASISHINSSSETISSILDFIGPLVGSISMAAGTDYPLAKGLKACAKALDQHFWNMLNSQSSTLNGLESTPDSVGMDAEFESQPSQNLPLSPQMDALHDEHAAISSPEAFRASVKAKFHWLSNFSQDQSSTSPSAKSGSLTTLNYLTSLTKEEFVLCKAFIMDYVRGKEHLSEDDVDTLLQYMQQVIVKTYELENSEVSIGLCIEILLQFTDWWTQSDSGDLADTSAELYVGFAEKLLSSANVSPAALCYISKLLQEVVQIHPDYMKELSLPSARTLLLKVLRSSDMMVKHAIGTRIPEIFGRFVLKEHPNILEDIIDTLPKDPIWMEGIALRFKILGNLAAAWPTLLRRCLYAIFETAGHVPIYMEFGVACVNHVTKQLELQDGRELFRLFVSQLIYTWLETQKVETIPYRVFGYSTIQELLADAQHEVVGQLIMRNKSTEYDFVRLRLKKNLNNILIESFTSAAAYCISRDIAVSPASDSINISAEKRLIDAVGHSEYSKQIRENFACIFSMFLAKADSEDQIQRAFEKFPVYAEANAIYQEILAAGHSDFPLPPGQQPSFKMKCLPVQVKHLCSRTSRDLEDIWTRSLYVFMFRNLVTSIHTALGSLHSCSILKKIRILICMAGSVALHGYPLEMALHALRPFLVDVHCADEAIGLLQYLLEHGAKYLTEVPAFLLGHAVSTLILLKAFLESRQDSTTQTSYFEATMSRAQAHRKWLLSYLNIYESDHLSTDALSEFRIVIRSASNLRSSGNANLGTYESDLLMALLKELRCKQGLLSRLCKDSILKFVCSHFERPNDFRSDVLGEDEVAAKFADAIWSTCQSTYATSEYLRWAARVIGRSYANHGLQEMKLVQETDVGVDLARSSSREGMSLTQSQACILRLLSDLLFSDDPRQVGWAETALRCAVTRAHGTSLSPDYEKCLGTDLYGTMLCVDAGVPLWTKPCARGQPEAQLQNIPSPTHDIEALPWVYMLSEALTAITSGDPLMTALRSVLDEVRELAKDAFPFILHIALLAEIEVSSTVKAKVSDIYRRSFEHCRNQNANNEIVKMLLNAFLYLRTQELPHENTKSDRVRWLDIDLRVAAQAAEKCAMYKTSLELLDIEDSEKIKIDPSSRKKSRTQREVLELPNELLLDNYKNLDEKDAFYGVSQSPNLSSTMAQLDYEDSGVKSLSFRSAFLDSELWQSDGRQARNQERMMKNLSNLRLDGLTQLLSDNINEKNLNIWSYTLDSARRLELWDVNPPDTVGDGLGSVFGVFRSINKANQVPHLLGALDNGFANGLQNLLKVTSRGKSSRTVLIELAVLVETEELLGSQGETQLDEVVLRLEKRDRLLETHDFDSAKDICSCRGTIFSSISKKARLREILKITLRRARLMECKHLLHAASISRAHGGLQDALSSATRLSHLVDNCLQAGLDISAASLFESAQVLWSHGERNASVNMLKELNEKYTAERLRSQGLHVGKAGLLAKLGHYTAEARLEKPDDIIQSIFKGAIAELHGSTEGDEASEVFHEFASFCDYQLQNSDSQADFHRVRRLCDRKKSEIEALDDMIRSATQAKEKETLMSHRKKAEQWFKLDYEEFKRLEKSRMTLVKNCLENYLRSLRASDHFDNDALRFSTLWLENSDEDSANQAVEQHIPSTPSRKFALLMNQWTSRLLDVANGFQKLLFDLIFRICREHPYHGMYQIFASSKTRGGKDETALARHAAAGNVAERIKNSAQAQKTWLAIHNTSVAFVRFAQERLDDLPLKPTVKPGSKVPLRRTQTGRRLEEDALKARIPPPTMSVELRADHDYSKIVTIAKFEPEFSVATGISMPKIVTAFGTDGRRYKQLFKAGNDDLRQDAIMEQVFGAVSSLLGSQQSTRQRDLHIRTYKVLPLTATAGVIEFVSNTTPLHDYLLPAHQRHYPKDFKPNVCRKHIQEAQSKSLDHRVKVFRKVCEQFHPVLRYYFQERFDSPEAWYERRLAYTRSTSAISILGHVLGLGDRHGHNILLDESTGEVIHIDLGIAFEQGRVLPVPEVVPFRLTRDIVDAMGITGTEGVFRRCCEFTLGALRNESYAIMSVLDVLRYDPLYSWSLSPLRLKKMQAAQMEDPALPADVTHGVGKRRGEEAGDAERALLVVSKKLSPTLSVQATVNELIQQAMDEKNLAALFCGWAAYA